jgi:hypothetical protein
MRISLPRIDSEGMQTLQIGLKVNNSISMDDVSSLVPLLSDFAQKKKKKKKIPQVLDSPMSEQLPEWARFDAPNAPVSPPQGKPWMLCLEANSNAGCWMGM